MYDDLRNWWNTDIDSSLPSSSSSSSQLKYLLPSFSFSLIDSSDKNKKFYISLYDLIVNTSDLLQSIDIKEGRSEGLPLFGSGDPDHTVCVLRGDSIGNFNGRNYQGVPSISLGSLVLKSLYFAADYSTGAIGFANKVDISIANYYYTDTSSYTPYCKLPVNCQGQQEFDSFSNSCADPLCSSYFFLKLDSSTHECIYDLSKCIVGVLFVCIFFIFEFSSSAIMKYIKIESENNHNNRTNNHRSNTTITNNIILAKYMIVIDHILIHILKWARRPQHHQQESGSITTTTN
jgi:hypothetical protein